MKKVYKIRREFSLEALIISMLISFSIFITIPLLNKVTLPKKEYNIHKFNTAVLKKNIIKSPLKLKQKQTEKSKRIKIKQQTASFKPLRIDTNLELDYSTDSSDILLGGDLGPDLDKNDFVFELEEVDTPPSPVRQIDPIFPINAKLKGIEGFVTLLFVVTDKGEVQKIRVEASEPGDIFDNAAIKALNKWRFKSALKDGKAVSVNVRITIQFNN